MGDKGNQRDRKRHNDPRTAQASDSAVRKKEEAINFGVNAYLDAREKRQRWVNILIIIIFILQLAIGTLTFIVILDIQKSNNEFIEMKRKATEKMLNDYNRQVQEYDRLLRDKKKQ
jgi:hypothetical protein